MTHTFIAYIDESGDDGLRRFRSPGIEGSTHWLGISSCLVRTINDLGLVGLRDDIMGHKQGAKRSDLHFHKLSHARKVVACQKIAEYPLRAITVLSDKITIPQGIYKERNQLYHYVTSYLIQRISWLCRDMRPKAPEGDGSVKIIFSQRGGMNYQNFCSYLKKLKDINPPPNFRYHWPVIDINAVDAKTHKELAGLQIADCIASAFRMAVDPDEFGNVEPRYASLLMPRCYSHEKRFASYGLKLIPEPNPADGLKDRKSFFQSFGYNI